MPRLGASQRRGRIIKVATFAFVITVTIVVIWIDVQTSVWTEVVILSGFTAGLVTFLFTALFVDRIITRAEQQRWIPVTQLAVSDLLHGLAHADSEITRGDIRPRYIALPDGLPTALEDQSLDELLHAVTIERAELASLLARWSAFLAVSADAQRFMSHMADVTLDLDEIRDAVLSFETNRTNDHAMALRDCIERYNKRVHSSVEELKGLLITTARDSS